MNTILVDTITQFKEQYYSKSIEEQRYLFFSGKISSHTYILVDVLEKEDSFHYREMEYIPKFGKVIYLSRKANRGFTYDKKTKKVSCWFGSPVGSFRFLHKLLEFKKLEWVINERFIGADIFLHWLTKTVLEKILSGKISNPIDCCKEIIKNSRFKGVSPEPLRKFIKNHGTKIDLVSRFFMLKNVDHYIILYLQNLEFKSTVGLQARKEKNERNDNFLGLSPNLQKDISDQCKILNVKIDVNWSKKRLDEEHILMTEKIMEYEVNSLSDIKLNYPTKLDLPSCFKILSTEKEVFREGKIMHHCIYTNYWPRINNRKYLAIHLDYQGTKVTIGVRKSNKGKQLLFQAPPGFKELNHEYIIDQMYSSYNHSVSPEIKSFVEQYIYNPKVQIQLEDFFLKDFVNKSIEEPLRYDEVDVDADEVDADEVVPAGWFQATSN